MICLRCSRIARSTIPFTTSAFLISTTSSSPSIAIQLRRTYSTSPSPINTAQATQSRARQGTPDSKQPPSATSTSAAQPFSTPLTPSPPETVSSATTPRLATVRSTVPEGMPLGLGLYKDKPEPVAMADDKYPSWLWDILKPEEVAPGQESVGDLYAKSKKQRQLAAKRLRKLEAMQKNLPPEIPVEEQSIDLYAGDGTLEGAVEAERLRRELTHAMRARRRATIKEGNYLKSMR